ncbi:hypothetical protein EVAR_22081_1 [Eumeta japonica]|uniref:Uncharacterized protein n=1 Tax=Eumeta variegata TaxID=151549 RepID=A0A4C1UT36_EUMVA|nr:hypothetical protein EVAR_22081_1 [Eumeta japonica]
MLVYDYHLKARVDAGEYQRPNLYQAIQGLTFISRQQLKIARNTEQQQRRWSPGALRGARIVKPFLIQPEPCPASPE